MSDNNSRQALIAISRYAGSREDLIQAGGGNTSVKLDNATMRVKSSGVLLSEVTEEHGFADVNIPQVIAALNRGEGAANEAIKSAQIRGGKPSIETFLHALTPGSLTLHTHPLALCMLACRKGGMDTLAKLFPDATLIGYAKPGYPLAILLNEAISGSSAPAKLIFLQNHGMVVSGETAAEVIDGTESALRKIESYLGISMDAYRAVTDIYKLLSAAINFAGIIYYCRDKALEDLGGQLFDFGYCPDCVVYCGKEALFLDALSETVVKEFYERNGRPAVVIYNGHYYAIADTIRKAREVETLLSFAARIFMSAKESSLTLPESERDFLLNWDAEKYRKNLK
jgi:rhamnose utilization protein RhaD (predicted bifunctional aldolase and dehydrogenase)